MSLVTDAELEAFRSDAESLMLDTGKALRPTGARTYDPAAQTEVDEYADILGSTAQPISCKVKASRSLSPQGAEAGDRTIVTIPAELHLPALTANAALRANDVWEIVTVHPRSLNVVGRRYRIASEVDGTSVTACRYTVERVVT